MAMKRMMDLLVIGLVLSLPLAVAREDGDEEDTSDDAIDEERYGTDSNDAAQVAAGPQVPQSLLIQQSPAAPAGLAAPAAAPPAEADVAVDAHNAKHAATVARQAAKLSNKVARHAIKITGHAKKSMAHALGALHDARVDSAGLGKRQKEKLKKAEAHLREASKKADFGKLKKSALEKMEEDLKRKQAEEKSKGKLSEKEQMRKDIQDLRKTLKEKNIDDKDIEKALHELEADLDKSKGPINDESKAELERLRQLVDSLDAQPDPNAKAIKTKPLEIEKDTDKSDKSDEPDSESGKATPIQEKGFDIDTAMPYGDLEPFGREDTAQELTESSVTESDSMVDQLERAEVAEEKRAVFRALTRLRGAAITSFDGVARSQTGNIDEYNKIHKWRNAHPLHHLADEESDISKWAFPDNADF